MSFWKIFGFGNPLDPVAIGTQYQPDRIQLTEGYTSLVMIPGTTHIIPMWQYALMNLGMEVLFMMACISFAFLVSTIFNSSMISVVVGVVIGITLSVLQSVQFTVKYMPYIFTAYGDSTAVIKGQLAPRLGNDFVTVPNAILVMLVWIVGCYVISHIVFTRKDILV